METTKKDTEGGGVGESQPLVFAPQKGPQEDFL
jgi:hypothetical protein